MDFLVASIFIMGLLTVYLLVDRFMVPDKGRETAPGTRIVPTLYMDQMDRQTGTLVKRFELNDSVMNDTEGYIIFGSGAGKVPRTGLKLSAVSADADTVSRQHALVYKEEDGYFIERNPQLEHATMQRAGDPENVKQIRIENGMVVFLGTQPLQFWFVNHNYTWTPGDASSADNDPAVRKKPVRRYKPGSQN